VTAKIRRIAPFFVQNLYFCGGIVDNRAGKRYDEERIIKKIRMSSGKEAG